MSQSVGLYQRAKGRSNHSSLQQNYKRAHSELKRVIKRSKIRCWSEVCSEIDNDPWGKTYQTVMARIKHTSMLSPTCLIHLRKIVALLFPRQPDFEYGFENREVEEMIPPVTQEELLKACSRTGTRKAPGPDGIPNIALKAAIRTRKHF